jgi:hypothetical protein
LLSDSRFFVRLPAAVSASASTTAPSIATVPASASATAAAAATATPSSTTSTTAEASASSPATSAASAFAGRPGFIDYDIAAHEIVAVESLNRALSFLVAVDLDKPEPARLPRETVAHQGDIRRGDSRLRK